METQLCHCSAPTKTSTGGSNLSRFFDFQMHLCYGRASSSILILFRLILTILFFPGRERERESVCVCFGGKLLSTGLGKSFHRDARGPTPSEGPLQLPVLLLPQRTLAETGSHLPSSDFSCIQAKGVR